MGQVGQVGRVGHTIQALVAHASNTLKQAGISAAEAELDARLLAKFVLGWDTTQFLTRSNGAAPNGFSAEYERPVARRTRREPLAYITGRKEFWTLVFEVSPAVLIPRPESELIIEAALARSEADAPLSIADVGTGSGCLAIALAHERRHATVVATDLSADALAVARANAVRHGVDGRVLFVETDLLKGVDQSFDLIVSNPPYVPTYEHATLQPEVRDYEPSVALLAGAGGLAIIRRLVDQSLERLARTGWLIFEFGYGQGEAARVMLASAKAFTDIQIVKDLQGIPRTAIARRI